MSELSSDFDISQQEWKIDATTLKGRQEMYNKLYEVPGTDGEINIKSIITNPAGLWKIFENLSWQVEDHKVSYLLLCLDWHNLKYLRCFYMMHAQ